MNRLPKPVAAPAPTPAPADDWTGIFDQAGQLLDLAGRLVTDYGLALAVTAVGTVATLGAARFRVRQWRTGRFAEDARIITISVPAEVDPGSAPAWWTHQAGLLSPWWKRRLYGQPHLAWEYLGDRSGVRVRVWVPGIIPDGMVESSIRAAWPGTTLTTAPAQPLLPTSGRESGGRLVPSAQDANPLRAGHDHDPLRALLGALDGLGHGQHIAVQILARPVTGPRLATGHRTAARLRRRASTAPQAVIFDTLTLNPPRGKATAATSAEHPERAGQVRAILAKAAQPRFAAEVRYALTTTSPAPSSTGAGRWVKGRAHSVASWAALYTAAHQHLRRTHLRNPVHTLNSRRLGRGHLLSTDELAALAHLPLDPDAPGITRAGARPIAPGPTIPTGPTPATGPARIIGDSDAGPARPIAVPVSSTRQHLHLLGQTGVGKTTLITTMVLADTAARRGALVLDPKGDLVTDILDRLPEHMIGKTVVFDPADPEPPPSVGILSTTGHDPAFATDAVVSIFHRCFRSAWGPRMDDLMRSACLTLTRVHGPNASLADIPQLLTDNAFRARIVGHLRDDLLRGFWTDYNELSPGGRAAVIGPVMNKLRAVLLRPFVHQVLSANRSTINIARHLDQGGLVLARLPKGVLGEDAARLLGSLLLAHTWQGITRRATTPEHKRRDATAYVDECHNFLNLPGSISDILAEARGYRFSLALAHQHLTQLPPELRDAISADARNKIYFTAAPEDAPDLARHTGPRLTRDDLTHLGAYQAAIRLIINGQPTTAFTIRTRPLPDPIDGRADAVRTASRTLTADHPGAGSRARIAPPPDDPRHANRTNGEHL